MKSASVASLVVLPFLLGIVSAGEEKPLTWQKDTKTAREAASASSKLVLELRLTGNRSGKDCARAALLMRHATFADPAVIERVERSFVAVSPDIAQDAKLSQEEEELVSAFAASWENGHASGLVRTVVTTAKGELVHVIPGFVSPKALARELDFALTVAAAAEKAGEKPEARRKAMAVPHLAAAEDLERRVGPSAHVAVIRQRAYIAGVEASSTGVTPVLNPVVGALNTGSVLEVKDAGIDGGGDPNGDDLAKLDKFLAGIHREIAALPATSPQDEVVAHVTPVAVLGPIKAPEEEIATARAALESRKSVERALAAHASREADAAAWKKALGEVKAAGKIARRFLLETLSDSTAASCAVLRHATGELIPDDVAAWRAYLYR